MKQQIEQLKVFLHGKQGYLKLPNGKMENELEAKIQFNTEKSWGDISVKGVWAKYKTEDLGAMLYNKVKQFIPVDSQIDNYEEIVKNLAEGVSQIDLPLAWLRVPEKGFIVYDSRGVGVDWKYPNVFVKDSEGNLLFTITNLIDEKATT